MAFNRNGTVQADGVTYQTAQPDIFAGGDVVTGPKFAIDAIAPAARALSPCTATCMRARA